MFSCSFFFFFNDTATTEIYTLSLHDALPISSGARAVVISGYLSEQQFRDVVDTALGGGCQVLSVPRSVRSEEHTSELQSQSNLVCRLLLEKKKKQQQID